MKKLGQNGRVIILFCIVLTIFLGYAMRLMFVQLVNGEEYLSKATQHSQRSVSVEAARGEIVDRYGRPLAVNRSCYNVIFDGAFMPKKSRNDIILELTEIFTAENVKWNESLPITRTEPYQFIEGSEKAAARVKKDLGLQNYATAQHVIDHLCESYDISEEYTNEQRRIVAGVRYEMEKSDFSAVNRYVFAEDVSMDIVTKVKENSTVLTGVDVAEGTIREYVGGNIAPHIIGTISKIYAEDFEGYEDMLSKGYTYESKIGRDGIEKAYESELKGKNGTRVIEFDEKGNVVSSVETVAPVPGNTVKMTIDSALQKVAYESLERQIKHLNETAPEGKGKEADAGAVVVVHVPTGEILAAVPYPSYNSNDYSALYNQLAADPLKPLFNRALNGVYAPGSTYKPSVATAGLAEGIITRNSNILCNRRYTYYSDYQPHCLSAHGQINVVTALSYSCNIFFYDTGRQLGIDTVNKYSSLYGLGQKTNLEIPTASGHLASPEYREKYNREWYPGDVLQASIGQSDNGVTPLQLAQYAATIARDGVRYESHLVKSVNSYGMDKVISETTPVVAAQIENKNDAFKVVKEGMLACARTGSARGWFANYPIDVAAKTGTPETSEFPNSVFISFAPVENSEIAVAVVIEKGWHGYTGAPVARDIYDYYFSSIKNAGNMQTEETLIS